MSTIYDYDIDALTKEMQRIMRIQDWDIDVRCVTANDMRRHGFDANTKGTCTKDRKHGDALIEINTDHEGNSETFDPDYFNDGWIPTYIHELLHVVTDGIVDQAETILEHISDKNTYKTLENDYDIKQERLVNHLTKIMLNIIPVEELLSKYKKGNQNGSSSEKTQ